MTVIRIAGSDDAGRGPVIGPLIIAGVLLSKNKETLLANIGVKDSKKLTPYSRRKLARDIVKIADKIVIKTISPKDIDDAVNRRTFRGLNHLEAVVMADVIIELAPDEAYLDSPDVKTQRFCELVKRSISGKVNLKIICANHADEIYPVVSAASIIAKETREKIIAELKKKYGDFGSGYPGDPKTRKFLVNYYREHGRFPSIVRKSWKTARSVMEQCGGYKI